MAARLRQAALPWLALALAFLHLGYWAAIPGAMDPDAYWVAAAGRWMAAHGRVPTQNLFSFTDPGHAWTMHEWLFGPLYALGLSHLGPRFFSYFVLLSAALTAAVLIACCIGRTRDWRVGAALAALALVAFGPRLASPRPPGVALFFPVAMAALAFGERFAPPEAIAAVVLELVWTNAHGSFPLGVALLAAGAIARRTGRPTRVVAAIAAALATLLNPYGTRLHALVFGYAVGSDPTLAAIRTHVLEFGPIWRAWDRVGVLAWVGALVLIALAAWALRTKERRVEAVVALLLFAYAALGVRHVELAGLVSVVLLAPALDGLTAQVRAPLSPARLAALAVFPALALYLPWVASGRAKDAGRLSPTLGGPPLIALAGKLPEGARVFTPFRAAGPLLWYRADPSVRVFYDSRNDCYSPQTMQDFLDLDTGALPSARVAPLLARYQTTAALVPEEHPVARALAADRGWTVAARAGTWLLLAPTAQAAEAGEGDPAR